MDTKHQLFQANVYRQMIAWKKDQIVVFMVAQIPDGVTITQLQRWNILPRTFLVNSLRRLVKKRIIRAVKETTEHLRVRYRYYPNLAYGNS